MLKIEIMLGETPCFARNDALVCAHPEFLDAIGLLLSNSVLIKANYIRY